MFEIDSTIFMVFSDIDYPLLIRLRRNKKFEVGLSIFESIPLPFLPYDLSYFYEELRSSKYLMLPENGKPSANYVCFY